VIDNAPNPESSPGTIAAHEADYKPAAWQQYTLAELGMWVHLLATRARHRDSNEKRAKDLYDARNYHAMMAAKLDALERELNVGEGVTDGS
jgi:hypothetical protein